MPIAEETHLNERLKKKKEKRLIRVFKKLKIDEEDTNN